MMFHLIIFCTYSHFLCDSDNILNTKIYFCCWLVLCDIGSEKIVDSEAVLNSNFEMDPNNILYPTGN